MDQITQSLRSTKKESVTSYGMGAAMCVLIYCSTFIILCIMAIFLYFPLDQTAVFQSLKGKQNSWFWAFAPRRVTKT